MSYWFAISYLYILVSLGAFSLLEIAAATKLTVAVYRLRGTHGHPRGVLLLLLLLRVVRVVMLLLVHLLLLLLVLRHHSRRGLRVQPGE